MAGVPPCIPCLFGARNLGGVPRSRSRGSNTSPKLVQNLPKVTPKSKRYPPTKPEYRYMFLPEKFKQKIVGIPPCISRFLGARILGRVWIPAFSKKTNFKKWRAFRPVFHVFVGARNLGRVLEPTGFVGSLFLFLYTPSRSTGSQPD